MDDVLISCLVDGRPVAVAVDHDVTVPDDAVEGTSERTKSGPVAANSARCIYLRIRCCNNERTEWNIEAATE